MNVVNGFYRPQEGTITYKGRLHRGMRTHEAAASGIARTFQNIALFEEHEHARQHHGRPGLMKMRTGLLKQALYWGPAQAQEVKHRRAVEKVIDFLEIEMIRKVPVGRLSYGLQKRVELARALVAEPDLRHCHVNFRQAA